jgi:putative transposase
MGAYHFTLGTRFHWREVAYEVTHLLPKGKVEIEDIATSTPREMATAELTAALFRGDLSLDVKPNSSTTGKRNRSQIACLDLSDYPPGRVAIARYRLECLQPLLALPPESRTRAVVETRTQEIRAAHASQKNSGLRQAISVASLYRWLNAYQESGQDLRALIPNTGRRGGKGQSRLETEVNRLVEQTIQELYKVREKVGLDDLLHEVAVRIEENNQLRSPTEQLRLPSRATIARRTQSLDLYERFAAKHGPRAARRHFKQSGRTDYPRLPLEQVEIDHTKADLIVLDDTDDLPLGRFTVTYCLDLCSRYPLGFYLGFEPPGYYPVMECLYHAICPKENCREKYGTTHDWLACGIPSALKVDNGKEFIGQSLDDACLSLGMVLNRAPVKTPEFKAGIERYLGTMNTMLLHQLPGTTFSNPRQRGDYDSVGQACVYLSDVEHLMVKYVLDVYAERPHRGLDGGIPAHRWEEALQSGLSPRVPASREELLILLGRVNYRSVNSYGIEFEHLRYNSPELASLRHRLQGQRVKIKYHPGDLSRVYVFDPFENYYLEAPACDPEGYTSNLSLWKHNVIRAYLLDHSEKPNPAALGRAKREIREIVQEAKRQRKQRARSKIARWESTPPSLIKKGFSPSTSPKDQAAFPDPAPAPPRLKLELQSDLEPVPDEAWAITYDLPRSRDHSPVRPTKKS